MTGTYTIIASHSNKALDVAGGGMTKGTNVQQYQINKTDSQKWWLVPCGNGYYNIVSKLNNLYLDINAARKNNGTNIQVYTGNKSNAQKFKILKVQTSGTKTIEDGTYNIYSKVANNRLIEVSENSVDNNILFQINSNENMAKQIFNVKYNGDGTYTITATHSGKVLDVNGASGKNGTVVQQYKSNNSDAQKWFINKNEDNTYSIISKCNGLSLDIAGGSSAKGARLQMYHENNSNAQKFTFENPKKIEGTQSAENGTYRIISKTSLSQFFDINGGSTSNGALLQTWTGDNSKQKEFKITYDGNGYYKIECEKSKKVLTVESENPKIGSSITQQEDRDLDTQKWILKKYSESVYGIVSKCGNLYMDTVSTAKNGQKIKLQQQTDIKNQQFIFVNTNPTTNISTNIKDGVYEIATTGNNTVIDISGGGQGNNQNVQIWKKDNVQQQRFYVKRINNTNYYTITAVHSGKVLDVGGGSLIPTVNVTQYSSNNSNAQKWLLRDCKDGYYNIISAVNGLYLDIGSGAVNTSGANIQMYFNNNTAAQKFKFVQTNAINTGTFEIETKLDSNKVVDIAGASNAEVANAQLWTASNVNQQRFKFEIVGWNTYKITAKHSNKSLTVGSDNDVYQATYHGWNTQQWEILPATGGYFYIVSKSNGKVLDVDNGSTRDGTNIKVHEKNGNNAQLFRFVTGLRKFYATGTYGNSGLAVVGDWRGTGLKYYKIGNGPKSLFLTFSQHGFEDSYAHDGAELTYLADEFNNYIQKNIDESTVNNWTIYIIPDANPDGQTYGWTNNGPGRCTIAQGIDMNRNWSQGYRRETSARYSNGTGPFQAYEVNALRDFVLNHRGISNFVVDVHGWLNETLGDNALGSYYRSQFGLPTHINAYGSGYYINWARTIGNARSVLVELPQVGSHNELVARGYATKFINATMDLIRHN